MKKIIYLIINFILTYFIIYVCLYLSTITKNLANPPSPTIFKTIVFFATLFFFLLIILPQTLRSLREDFEEKTDKMKDDLKD